ncbi:MAG: hypothetical protein HGB21_12920, partial [Nitrospirae bacterium]|nr:hypothetical protein [Nitrospirota bacterium]
MGSRIDLFEQLPNLPHFVAWLAAVVELIDKSATVLAMGHSPEFFFVAVIRVPFETIREYMRSELTVRYFTQEAFEKLEPLNAVIDLQGLFKALAVLVDRVIGFRRFGFGYLNWQLP